MAPTEIPPNSITSKLAAWLEPLGISVGWLAGSPKKGKTGSHRTSGARPYPAGHRHHALFQDQVEFAKLGLAIVDEQHRFGVHQRLALRNRAAARTS